MLRKFLKTGVTAAENTVLQSQNNIFFCKSCNKERVVDLLRSKSFKMSLFGSDTSEMIKHMSRQYTKEKENELNKEGMILLPSFSPQVPQFSPQIELSL